MKMYVLKAYYEFGEKTAEFIISHDYEEVVRYQNKLEKLLNKWVHYYVNKYYSDDIIKHHFNSKRSPRFNFFMTVADTFIEEIIID